MTPKDVFVTEFPAEPSRAPQPGTYAAATEQAFGRCPNLSGLQLLSVECRHGFLTARFEGPIGDFRGPYGVVVRLPKDQLDDQWTKYAGSGTVDEWAYAAVAMRAVNAHAASTDQDREYSPDGIWWLIRDANPE